MKKTILIILASFFIQCSNNLNNLTEEAFHGRWSSHVQYTETISTDVVFSIDSITDLIFLEEMTLVQYELDENNQRMPSTDFVDRSTPDRDVIKQMNMLRRKHWMSRRKTRERERLIGLYQSPELILPYLIVHLNPCQNLQSDHTNNPMWHYQYLLLPCNCKQIHGIHPN